MRRLGVFLSASEIRLLCNCVRCCSWPLRSGRASRTASKVKAEHVGAVKDGRKVCYYDRGVGNELLCSSIVVLRQCRIIALAPRIVYRPNY